MEFEVLIQQPESLRDECWEDTFLTQFPQLKVLVDSEPPEPGPDGWPYLHVRTDAQASEPVLKVIQWLAAKGIGLVVNAHKMMPDYVFTYGMLWNFVETGRFVSEVVSSPKRSELIIESNDKVLMGAPSEKYLPPYVRTVLRQFMRVQGFGAPRVLVISSQDYAHVDLVFSVESLNNLAEKDHKVMAEMLAWFLPMHYSLVFSFERGLAEFVEL